MPIKGKSVFIEPKQHYLEYSSCVAREVEEEIAGTINTIPLRGSEANPGNCTYTVNTEDPIHVWGVGHGNANVYTVECTNIWLDARNPSSLDPLIGRVVHLLSCITAQNLGPALIEHGSIAYFGYYDSFWFMIPYDPCTNRMSRSTHTCDLEIERSLAKGRTTGQAKEDCLARFDEEITYWESSDDPYAADCLWCLETDKDRLRLYGDETVTITEAPTPPGPGGILPLLLGGGALLALPMIMKPAKKKPKREPTKIPEEKDKKGLLIAGVLVAGIAAYFLLKKKPPVPPPGKAYINVNSTPTGADVYLNGSYIGKTPISNYELDPGTHTLLLVKEGYEDYTETFTISEDETKTFNITLTPITPPEVSAEITEFTITSV